MLKFKKTCYNCGKQIDTLYEGRCETCYKEDNPPIKELKPLNLKYCNGCKKIHYQNQYITTQELEKRLPNIVQKNIILNKNYTLKKLEIKDFEIKGAKVSFDVKVNCNLEKY